MIRFSGGAECTVKSEKSPLRRGLFSGWKNFFYTMLKLLKLWKSFKKY